MFHSFAQGSSASLQYVGGHSWNYNTNFEPFKEVLYNSGEDGEMICHADSLGLTEDEILRYTNSQTQNIIREAFGDRSITLVRIERHREFVWGKYVYSFVLSGGNLAVCNF